MCVCPCVCGWVGGTRIRRGDGPPGRKLNRLATQPCAARLTSPSFGPLANGFASKQNASKAKAWMMVEVALEATPTIIQASSVHRSTEWRILAALHRLLHADGHTAPLLQDPDVAPKGPPDCCGEVADLLARVGSAGCCLASSGPLWLASSGPPRLASS